MIPSLFDHAMIDDECSCDDDVNMNNDVKNHFRLSIFKFIVYDVIVLSTFKFNVYDVLSCRRDVNEVTCILFCIYHLALL